jgi:hypothetical protein
MSENDKSWIIYLENRIKILDIEAGFTADNLEKERDYLKGEIEKIKKANKDRHPG